MHACVQRDGVRTRWACVCGCTCRGMVCGHVDMCAEGRRALVLVLVYVGVGMHWCWCALALACVGVGVCALALGVWRDCVHWHWACRGITCIGIGHVEGSRADTIVCT